MTLLRNSRVSVAAMLLLASTGIAHASGPIKITASDAGAGDNFGRAVSLDGDTMIVGAIQDDDGGSDAGARVNRHLVQAAQQAGIPVGLGSMRVLLKHPDLFDHFYVKPLAPDVPVWANLSAAQLQHCRTVELTEWLKRLEVQALVLHCNVGQEQCCRGQNAEGTGDEQAKHPVGNSFHDFAAFPWGRGGFPVRDKGPSSAPETNCRTIASWDSRISSGVPIATMRPS